VADDQLLIGFKEGLKSIGLGLTKGKEKVASGKLRVKRDGRLLKFTPEYLREYVESLPEASPDDVLTKDGSKPGTRAAKAKNKSDNEATA
jgi:hypothetical protein